MQKFNINDTYEIAQFEYCMKMKKILSSIYKSRTPKVFLRTYGCQQNVSDSEKYKGMLLDMGFELIDDKKFADVVMFNTCAIRENAENRAFGNLGWIKSLKKSNPNLFVVLCGCMTEQESVIAKIKTIHPFVDLVFGTHSIHKFPQIFHEAFVKRHEKGKKTLYVTEKQDIVPENLPIHRDSKLKAFVSIMYGCNNFCSYCIVPYVRGRERSRTPEKIISEFKSLIENGYKDITLLGQNVNSYGRGLESNIDFPGLLRKLDSFDGEYKIRFMTSHPKDATKELFFVIAESRHIAHHIHLPVQCGSDRILGLMNRKYTISDYLEKVSYAKSKIPDLILTSDIIVGFPGETYDDFRLTVELLKKVRFSSVFTFIYSPRVGTPAAKLPDLISKEEKTKWLLELLDEQKEISKSVSESMIGKKMRVLAESFGETSDERFAEGSGDNARVMLCRTDGDMIVTVTPEGRSGIPEDLIGNFVDVEITGCKNESLTGKLLNS